jgi:ubiquinone/menaquinone biosynthesis C-methylase UbiE
MDKAEFDQFADEYYLQHKQNIAITGESPEYFAEYKIREVARIAKHRGIRVTKLLDFGSGVGNSIPYFQRFFPTADLTCADVSQRSLEVSQSRYPDAGNLVVIESDRVPVQDGSFDLAFSACVFHHIPETEHVLWLRELGRITSAGGMVVIFEHNPLNPLTVHAVNTCPFDVNAKLIRAHELVRRLLDAGWTEPKIRYHVFFPHLLSYLRVLEPRLKWLPLGAQYCVAARKPH